MRNRANEKEHDVKVGSKYCDEGSNSATYESKSEPVRKKSTKKNTNQSGALVSQSYAPAAHTAYDTNNLHTDPNGYSIQNILNFAQQYTTPLKSMSIKLIKSHIHYANYQ